MSIWIADLLCCQQELTQHCKATILQFEKKEDKAEKIKCSKYSSKRQRVGVKMKEKLRQGTQSKKLQDTANKDYRNKSEIE